MTVAFAPPLPIVKERLAKFTTTNKKNSSKVGSSCLLCMGIPICSSAPRKPMGSVTGT